MKSGDQLAFMFCRKKDGLFDMDRLDGKKKKVSFPSRKESILKMKYLNNYSKYMMKMTVVIQKYISLLQIAHVC